MNNMVSIIEAVEITNNRVKPFSGKKRYLATGDLKNQNIEDTMEFVDYETKPSRADLVVNVSDIIVAKMHATNKVILIDENSKDIIVSTGFLTLKPKKEFDAEYLLQFFRSENFHKQKDKLCSGATQKAINNGAFEKIKIPKYPIEEQKRIAKLLDKADTLRKNRQESIKLLDDFLKATFYDMFGDPVRNERGWLIKAIKDICEARLGKMLDSKKQTGVNARLYLRNANVLWDSFNLSDISMMDFDEKDRIEFRLKKGDILICEGGEIGRTAIWEEQVKECYYQKAIHRLKLNLSIIQPEYFVYLMWFYSKKGGFKDFVSTATISHLTGEKLQTMKIPIPGIILQNTFAQIYRKIQDIKKTMECNDLDNQFNALIQRYFE